MLVMVIPRWELDWKSCSNKSYTNLVDGGAAAEVDIKSKK